MPRALIVEIFGNAKQFGAELDRAAGKTARFGKAAGVAGLAIAGGLAYGMEKSVKAAMDAQASTARLETAFKSSGESAKKYSGEIDGAESAGRKLGFMNTDLRDSLGSLEVATGNHTKAIKLMSVAEDVARFKHVGLTDASKMLSMAMAGSQRAAKQLGITVPAVTTHYDALKRTGMDLTTVQGRQAEATAKLADKNATIAAVIGLVTAKTKGQAAAFADTAQGGMQQFHAQVEALEESLGKVLLPAVVAVSEKLASFAEFLSKHTTITKILVVALGTLAVALMAVSVASAIASAATAVFAAVMFVAASPILLVVAALAVLGIAIYEIVKHWGAISAFFASVWDKIKGVFMAGIHFVEDHWRAFAIGLATIIAGPLGALVAFIATHWGRIKAGAQAAWAAITGAVRGAWNAITGAVSHGVSAVLAIVKSLPGKIVAALGNLGHLLYSAGLDLMKGLANGIIAGVKGVIDKAKGAGHAVVSGIKSVLGIGSPSKVFHEIGLQMMAGLDNGMAAGAAQLKLGGMTGGIVAAATPGTVGTPARTGGGGSPVHVTVNGWVGNDHALANKIRNELVNLGRREPNIFGGYA